jgi:hypothetical protein
LHTATPNLAVGMGDFSVQPAIGSGVESVPLLSVGLFDLLQLNTNRIKINRMYPNINANRTLLIFILPLNAYLIATFIVE